MSSIFGFPTISQDKQRNQLIYKPQISTTWQTIIYAVLLLFAIKMFIKSNFIGVAWAIFLGIVLFIRSYIDASQNYQFDLNNGLFFNSSENRPFKRSIKKIKAIQTLYGQ